MASPTLLTLPAETRKMIYEQLLPKEVDFNWCQYVDNVQTPQALHTLRTHRLRIWADRYDDQDATPAAEPMSSRLKQYRVCRLHLLLTNKHIKAEASLVPTAKICITICCFNCMHHWRIQTSRTEKDDIGSFKVSIPLRDTTYQFKKEGDALIVEAKWLEDRKLEVMQMLKKHYKEVKLTGEKIFVASDDGAKESKEWVELHVDAN